MPVIETKVTITVHVSNDDQVNVLYSGEIEAECAGILGAAHGNHVQVYGSVRSSNDTAIILGNNCSLYVAGPVEGKTGGIRIGAMDDEGNIGNLGDITSSSGAAISGRGRLKIGNGVSWNTDALISGKDFGIDFISGSGADDNLDITNFATIRGGMGIRSLASDDVVNNSGTIQGIGGIALSLGAGNDIYNGSSGTAMGLIDMGEGEDQVFGGTGADVIVGGAGNDAIDGGAGADTAIFSGQRSDYAVTRNANGSYTVADKRTNGDGSDTVLNVELFRFADKILNETDVTVGDPANSGNPGNPVPPENPVADRILYGTRAKDTLVGSAGNDKLYGNYGNDALIGGAGKDTFVFNSKLGSYKTDRKKNFDRISDFSVQDDAIWLDNKYFKKLGKKGSEMSPKKLNKKFFKIGEKAKDKNDYLVYSKKKGILSYDADGSGSKKAIEIAKLDKRLKLKYDDFWVV